MLKDSFHKLRIYCEKEEFKGWDPYDGLNSKVYNVLPFRNFYIPRLAWIQLFKRSPINLRKLLLVKKDFNPKGVSLFLTGYTNLAIAKNNDYELLSDTHESLLQKINLLADKLIDLRTDGYSGACWGYNFDWQNRVFFQPKYTPTVVATSFCADSLFNAYEITGNEKYLDTALSAANFITKDLNRTISDNGFIFSYSPLDNSKVYNASLLGARLLARASSYTGNKNHKCLAKEAVDAIVSKQNQDGSWIYGEATTQNWIDNFHTGYNLECIYEYQKFTKDDAYLQSFERGMDYYLRTFFLDDGRGKYYNNKIYPIDIHAPAQLIVTLAKTNLLLTNRDLVGKVMNWTIKNMQDKKGFFYYQIKKGFSSKIPYMRWAEAWMFYAFSNYFKTIAEYESLD
jgi:rhamnogalacturonyl hydrolase YesR